MNDWLILLGWLATGAAFLSSAFSSWYPASSKVSGSSFDGVVVV